MIMAIGEQRVGDVTTSAHALRQRYDNLIREAITKARPSFEVLRADEVAIPGTITTDIIARIMHSDFVVADVTYPNPNVFYELGLRHACRPGTIIIRENSGQQAPFDIAHLRHIGYDDTTAGLKSLAMQLSSYFDHFERNPDRPDNQFLEYAKLTAYQFPNYQHATQPSLEVQAFMGLLESPELLELLMKQKPGETVDQMALMRATLASPKVAQPLMQAMVKSGRISLGPAAPPAAKNRRGRR